MSSYPELVGLFASTESRFSLQNVQNMGSLLPEFDDKRSFQKNLMGLKALLFPKPEAGANTKEREMLPNGSITTNFQVSTSGTMDQGHLPNNEEPKEKGKMKDTVEGALKNMEWKQRNRSKASNNKEEAKGKRKMEDPADAALKNIPERKKKMTSKASKSGSTGMDQGHMKDPLTRAKNLYDRAQRRIKKEEGEERSSYIEKLISILRSYNLSELDSRTINEIEQNLKQCPIPSYLNEIYESLCKLRKMDKEKQLDPSKEIHFRMELEKVNEALESLDEKEEKYRQEVFFNQGVSDADKMQELLKEFPGISDGETATSRPTAQGLGNTSENATYGAAVPTREHFTADCVEDFNNTPTAQGLGSTSENATDEAAITTDEHFATDGAAVTTGECPTAKYVEDFNNMPTAQGLGSTSENATDGAAVTTDEHFSIENVEDFMDKLFVKKSKEVGFSDFPGLPEAVDNDDTDHLKPIDSKIRKACGKNYEAAKPASDEKILVWAAIKEMEDLPLEQVNEAILLKWRDTFCKAEEVGFRMDFAKRRLEEIARAHFGAHFGVQFKAKLNLIEGCMRAAKRFRGKCLADGMFPS